MIEVTELGLDDADYLKKHGKHLAPVNSGSRLKVSQDGNNIYVTAVSFLKETQQIVGQIYELDDSFAEDPDLDVGKNILFKLEHIHSIETNPDSPQ